MGQLLRARGLRRIQELPRSCPVTLALGLSFSSPLLCAGYNRHLRAFTSAAGTRLCLGRDSGIRREAGEMPTQRQPAASSPPCSGAGWRGWAQPSLAALFLVETGEGAGPVPPRGHGSSSAWVPALPAL